MTSIEPIPIAVSLSLPRQEVSILVPTTRLAKPHSSALTFYARDPEASLVLARLRVVGWAGSRDRSAL